MSAGRTESLLGYEVWSADPRSCVESIVEWIRSGDRPRWLACLNPHSYVVADRAAAFSDALRRADWLVPDGMGIVLASRLRGGMIRQRVTGSDIFSGVHGHLQRSGGGRVFFLGSTLETLGMIERRLASDYPNVKVVGSYSPPFKPEYTDAEIADMVAAVNAAVPDVLWVGMTAPKQELWIDRALAQTNVKFAAAVGAVFDFYSGRIPRSHPVFQRIGLEWLPRLLREPRRLSARMFVSAPLFIWRAFRG